MTKYMNYDTLQRLQCVIKYLYVLRGWIFTELRRRQSTDVKINARKGTSNVLGYNMMKIAEGCSVMNISKYCMVRKKE